MGDAPLAVAGPAPIRHLAEDLVPADMVTPLRPRRPAPTMDEHCDALVIGGGPAGSTISALLSEKGWKVTLLEKARHPRFHIGESLLPRNLPILDQLGVLEEVERIGVMKHGADLTLLSGATCRTFNFSEADASSPTAFQVERAAFDALLLSNSAAKGTRVLEGVRATAVEFPARGPARVRSVDDGSCERTWAAEFVVDASGRDTLLGNLLGIKVRNHKHNSAALFAHFDGVKRRPGKAAGNISVYWFDHGWFWIIPLPDGRSSVGAVCWPAYLRMRKVSPEQFFMETIALCPPLARRLENARLATPVMAAGNYSYSCKLMFGERYLLVGDAYAFVDPVFSTGVFLSMHAAALGAETVNACLRDPAGKKKHLRRHARIVRRGLCNLSWFIYRFTTPAMQRLFMASMNPFNMRQAVISLLAGDVFRGTPRVAVTLFKIIYFILSLERLKRSLVSYRRR